MSEVITKQTNEIDDEEATQLSESEINKRLDGTPSEPPKPPEEDTANATPPVEDQTGNQPPAEPTPELLAGKYKTFDDLKHAALELNTKLYGETTAARLAAKELTAVTDTTELTDLYKSLESELGKQSQPEPPELEPDSQIPPEETGDIDQATYNQAVAQETVRQFSQTPLWQEMRQQGIEFPSTAEQWQVLKDAYPYYASRLESTMENLHNTVEAEAKAYRDATLKEDSYNSGIVESNRQKIIDFAKDLEINLKPEEIQQFIDANIGNQELYKDFHGASYLKEDALLKHWLASEFPKYTKAIKDIYQAKGRMQGVDDVEAARNKAVRSIGTSHVPAQSTRTKTPIKVTDIDEEMAGGLSEEEINKALSTGQL